MSLLMTVDLNRPTNESTLEMKCYTFNIIINHIILFYFYVDYVDKSYN